MTQKRNNNRPDRARNKKQGNDSKVLTQEERNTIIAKQFNIKPKTREFVDILNSNPKISASEAYMQVHKTTNKNTAKTGASKLLQKPSVIGYKDSAVGKAKRRIVSLVDSNNESISLKASQDIIDRNEGKAIQKSENISRTVEVKLDLTGVRLGAHYIAPNDVTDV